ncbi:MAG: excisionase family DNA-binding protein [Acidobacteriota bacterium]
MKASYLSTGRAAKLLSVTPDTVLKWIKSGKLSAHSTTGGHYRIHPGELERLRTSNRTAPATGKESFRKNDFLYCWEYNNAGGVSDRCGECIVYKTRAQRCYELVKIKQEIGHKKFFCEGSCGSCEYFQTASEAAIRVLIITGDDNLVASLKEGTDIRKYEIEVADCGYTCSAVLEKFKPDCILIDCSIGLSKVSHIVRHLLKDHRVSASRMIMAGEKGKFPADCDKDLFECIEKPFDIEELKKRFHSPLWTEGQLR